MPRVRYKKTGTEAFSSRLNTYGYGEVLTGDDSCPIKEMDVYLEQKKEWKDMSQAFKDNDLISDNYHEWFGEPTKQEDKDRGYFL